MEPSFLKDSIIGFSYIYHHNNYTIEKQAIIALSDALYEASKSIRILRSVNWSQKTRADFFAQSAQVLPEVSYPDYDPSETLHLIDNARALILDNSPFENWGNRIADKLENGARLLSSMGTSDFYKYSARLYGTPKDILPDGETNSLDLALFFEEMYKNIEALNIEAQYPESYDAKDISDRMRVEVNTMFGDDAPEIIIDDEVSSKVIAGRRRIRVRSTAMFDDNDIDQLIHHEAFVHVATSINGYQQKSIKILRASHPGTTKTQEGLAVFAEFITGHIDLERIRRLSDRVLAIQMAVDGADFIDVYRYYLDKIGHQENAYESARRVFRGGVITGGAPFTKDMVYLDGLLRVHNFLRVVVSSGKADLLPLLFAGKMDLEDIDVVIRLRDMGLIELPKYLPPWMKDIRFLLTYLAYSSFLNSVKLTKLKDYYSNLIC